MNTLGIECAAVCRLASEVGFVDPVTGLPPLNECSLSALLTIYHHARRISWDKVPLLQASGEPSGETAAIVFRSNELLCGEYPLFWNTPDELEARGDMRPDWLLLSEDHSLIAIVENKVGAPDTHKGDSYGGQMGRYIHYLKSAPQASRYVILITSKIYLDKQPPWYATEFQESVMIQGNPEGITSRIIRWEDILGAFHKSPNNPLQPKHYAG